MKAIIRLMLLLLLAGCTAESELPPLPTLVEFPSPTSSPEAQTISQNPSESPTETPVASASSADATESPQSTIASSPTVPADAIWLTLEGAKAYECINPDCAIVLELPAGLRFVPLESLEDWHTVRLDAATLVYIPVAATRRLTAAELNASATPTSSSLAQPSATISISQNPTNSSVIVPPISGGGGIVPPPLTGGQNPPPPVSNVPTDTPVVVNTLVPTYTRAAPNNTDVPPTPTLRGANDLPFFPSDTPTFTPPPPPLIVLPPPS